MENSIITLRAVEPEDLALLYLWENNRDVWHVSNTLVPFSKHQLQQYIDSDPSNIHAHQQLRMMIDCREKPDGVARTVGIIDLFDFDPMHQRAGVGILIASPEDRRQGYAYDALQLIIDYGRQVLHLHQLFCNIPVSNTASIRLFEKSGFQIAGNKKDWLKTANGWEDEYLLQYFFD